MKFKKVSFLVILAFMLSSFGKRTKNPPEDPCGTRLLRIYLGSEVYMPNPSVSFNNTVPCPPVSGQWRDPSSSPSAWSNTANYFKMVRIEVVPRTGGCTNVGRYWNIQIVRQNSIGNCYVDVPVYKKYTNDIIINGLSDCYLPGLPVLPSPMTGSRIYRAHYVPTRSWEIWGGSGGASVLKVRMRVQPFSFSSLNRLTRC